MKKMNKVICITVCGLVILVGMAIIGSNINSSSQNQNNVSQNNVADDNPVTEDTQEEVPIVEENPTKWGEHKLGKYKFILTNDSFAIVVKKIDKVEDTIRLTYTFINESDDATSAIWNFQCVPYQNGISLNDSDEYGSHYYECGKEQTSIKNGYSIDGCWELIPIGDGSEIECDMGAGMWNETHTLKINPKTLEWTVEEK